MSRFPSDAHLSSWAGISPGNNESAGKRHSGKSSVRKHHLKTIMIEVAWAAVKVKGSYYREKYYRLKARRGAKRAIVGIAHRVLKAVYHILKDGVPFKDPGEDFLNRANGLQNKLRRLRNQAHQIGYALLVEI